MRPLTTSTSRLFTSMRLSDADRLSLTLSREGRAFHAEIYQQSSFSDGITFPSSVAGYDFPGRIPERKSLDSSIAQNWEFAATDLTAAIIHAVWPAGQIILDDDARLVYRAHLAEGLAQDCNAARAAEYRASKVIPENGMALHPEFPLVPYQQLAAHNLSKSTGYALFMEQGTGKTPVIIAHVCNAAVKMSRKYRAIVVCPNNVRLNWKNEFAKFSTVPGMVTVLRGSDIVRAKQLLDAFSLPPDMQYTVVVCSYDTVPAEWDRLKLIKWDFAVLDESHYIKTPTTRRFKFACKLRDRSTQRAVLTGTPITNSVLDLYAQFEFLGAGYSGFRSWKNFRAFYGKFRQTENGYRQLIGSQNLPFIQERLARVAFLISLDEALPNLPEKLYDVVEVEMGAKQAKLYETLRKELVIEIENDMASTKSRQLVVSNVLTKLLRLAQITSGFITWDAVHSDEGETLQESVVERIEGETKLLALMEILRATKPNEKTIVWACWVSDIRAITDAVRGIGLRCVTYYGATSEAARQQAVEAYNYDPLTQVWVGSPAAGGVGLNLLGHPPEQAETYETNTTHEIYYSQNWSPTARSQSEARAHRKGTRVPVRITDLCVPGTIDEEIRARVLEKKIDALKITDLRKILRNVLKGGV